MLTGARAGGAGLGVGRGHLVRLQTIYGEQLNLGDLLRCLWILVRGEGRGQPPIPIYPLATGRWFAHPSLGGARRGG